MLRTGCTQEDILATVEGTGIARQTREFESTIRSLTELKEWLLELGVTHVAMESTGVYWKTVINILEPAGFTLLVVNAQHIKYVPGHKTDKKDSKLLRAGLLKGSFIPDRAQRDLRDLTRYRRKKVQVVTAEKNRMLKGNTDPDYLASLCMHGKLKSSKEQIRDVVEGVFTEHYNLSFSNSYT